MTTFDRADSVNIQRSFAKDHQTMTPKFKDIVNILAAVRCLNAGQTVEEVAKSAKVSPRKVRGWLNSGGFRRLSNGQYRTSQ